MSDPAVLRKGAAAHAKLRSIVHGDLWHNNVFFNSEESLLIADWQMCHVGNAANDLCFLIFSSTTPSENRIIAFFIKILMP